MTTPNDAQDGLSAEIDGLDDQIHDLLVTRAELSGREGAAFRPAREAEIMRRLVARHRGATPIAGLMRVWREILAASARAENGEGAPIAVHGGENATIYWDLARAHFGADSALALHATATHAVLAVAQGAARAAVLPVHDAAGETAPWWVSLIALERPNARVVARLPSLIDDGPSARAGLGARGYVVAAVPFEASGDDRSLIAVTVNGDMSRASLLALMAAQGLPAQGLESAREGGGPDGVRHLVEIDGYVDGEDARLAALARAARSVRAVDALGGYPRPIDLRPAREAVA